MAPSLLSRTLILLVVFPLVSVLSAQTIVVSPHAAVPWGASSFGFGAGATLGLRLPFGEVDLVPRLGWEGLFLSAGGGRVDAVTAGADVSLNLVRTNGFTLGPVAGLGGYGAFFPGASALFNPTASVGLRAGIQVGSVRLDLEPRLDWWAARKSGTVASFWTGLGVSAQVGFDPVAAGAARPRLRILDPRLEPFYPSFYKYYATQGLGSVDLVNDELDKIQDLRVQVYAPRYMDGPQTVATWLTVAAGARVPVPLAALFRNEVLSVTETDAAQVQILASYRRGAQEFRVQQDATLRILGRNSISWDDDRKVAAFVTSRDPTILKFGRNVVAGVPVDAPGPGSEALRKAAAVFAALGESGLRYVVDPASSYANLSQVQTAVDYVQFPIQTLDYRSGDCDDLSVLYAALLEAVGVETAFLLVPGHILVAFDLDLTEAEARSSLSSLDDLIIRQGKVWVPVEATLVNKGFLTAWAEGARAVRAGGTKTEVVPVRQAWQTYEASFIDSTDRADVVARAPAPAKVLARYRTDLRALTDRELSPLVADLRARLLARPTPGLQNRLGTTYARFGVFDKAEEAFQVAAKANFPQAFYNLGNLKLLQGDRKAALVQYERAFQLNPDSGLAALAVARVAFDLGDLKKAGANYGAAKVLEPQKALAFAYIAGGTSLTGGSTVRAGNEGATSVEWNE